MGVYRILWRSVVGAVVVVGAATAFLSLPLRSVMGLAVCGAILGPSVGARIHFRTHRIPVPTLAYLLKASAVTTVGVLALSGLIALCGVTALLEMGVLAACSPTVLRRFSPCTPVYHRSRADTGAGTPDPRAPSYHLLSDAELCWRWRTSYGALQHTVSPDQRLFLITTRSALLDELAHRDPQGFTRWLDSGADAASDPARYLDSPHSS